jgi:hypothetical protein
VTFIRKSLQSNVTFTDMKKALGLGALILAVIPGVASAQIAIGGLIGILEQAKDLINRLIPFIIALTLLVFLWGVFKFVISGGDSDARKEAQGYMIWGIIALFVMVSVWGLVNILVRTFNLDTTAPVGPAMPDSAGQFVPSR